MSGRQKHSRRKSGPKPFRRAERCLVDALSSLNSSASEPLDDRNESDVSPPPPPASPRAASDRCGCNASTYSGVMSWSRVGLRQTFSSRLSVTTDTDENAMAAEPI